jgi:hypothetical protein
LEHAIGQLVKLSFYVGKFWRQRTLVMPETPAKGNKPDLRRCTGNDMPGKVENTSQLRSFRKYDSYVSEEEKLNFEMHEKIRFLRQPSEMQANMTLFQGRCAKEMPSKAREQEKFEARKKEECPEQKSQQIQERDARKSPEELANANIDYAELANQTLLIYAKLEPPTPGIRLLERYRFSPR